MSYASPGTPPSASLNEVDIEKSLVLAPHRAEPAPRLDAVHGANHVAAGLPGAFETATGASVANVAATGPIRVPELVACAQRAACAWGGLSFLQRGHALVRLRELVAQRAREIAETIGRGTGKPLIEAMLFEVAPVIHTLDDCIAHATDDLADEPIAALVTLPALLGCYREALFPRSPRAVVCVIAHIGSPFELAMTPAVFALTAGNAVIVKASSAAAPVGVLIERLFEDAFTDFPDLAQVVHGARELGAALTTYEGVDAVLSTRLSMRRKAK